MIPGVSPREERGVRLVEGKAKDQRASPLLPTWDSRRKSLIKVSQQHMEWAQGRKESRLEGTKRAQIEPH